MRIERTAIVGKGALGVLYADCIARNVGDDAVCFVMDEARLQRHATDVTVINGIERTFRSAKPADVGPVDLILFAVKAPALDEALELAAPLVGERTLLISVLNGVTSEERIAARFGWERIVPCVAQGMDAMRFGSNVSYSQAGNLHIGLFEQTEPSALDAVQEFFARSGIGCIVEKDIRHRMWAKFMGNVGLNQVCAAYGIDYETLLASERSLAEGKTDPCTEPWRAYIAAMREVVAVGRAEGVDVGEADLADMVALLRTLDPHSTPSMGQDVINRNPTEVDEFSGVMLRLAAKHGLLVPTNAFLNARLKEIEASYAR